MEWTQLNLIMKQYTQVFTTSLPVDLLANDLYKVLCEQVDNIEPAQQEYYVRVAEAIIDPIADNSAACAHLFNTINGWVKLPTPLDKANEDALANVEAVGQDTVEQVVEEPTHKNHREIMVDDYVSISVDDINTQTDYGELTFADSTKVIGKVKSITNTDRVSVKFRAIRNYSVVEFYHFFTIEVLRLLPSLTGKNRLDKYNKSLADALQP